MALDRATLAQLVKQLGLVTDSQLQECLAETADQPLDGDALYRAFERKSYLTPFQVDKLEKGDRHGFFLGGYRLLYKIASGSFGRVHRGDDPQSGRVVAIKVLRKRFSEDPGSIELFEREARVGMSLQHPNIVEILSVGHDAMTRQYFIVMEFVEGGNLRDLLAIRRTFEARDALKLIEDMASALVYAFARNVTHRDIKLTNILISSQGVAKLVDFGLARMYKSIGKGDDNEHVARTVDYAGIEKSTGVAHGDIRSDIYFLGCVLYEMLTGRPPMPHTRDRHARMRKERFLNIPPIHPDEIKGPTSIIRLVEIMMAFNPQQRYQTPIQLLDAIREVRGQLEGGSPARGDSNRSLAGGTAPTIFVVEKDARLQDVIRHKLKGEGYRVLIAGDPTRAVERFNHLGFQALIVDLGTTFAEGLQTFKYIMNQARDKNVSCTGICILPDESEDQEDYATLTEQYPSAVILSRPLKLGLLVAQLRKLVPVAQPVPGE